MTRATTFSTRTGSPSPTGTVSICPAYPGFPTTRRATETDVSSRKTRVRAALGDTDVRLGGFDRDLHRVVAQAPSSTGAR